LIKAELRILAETDTEIANQFSGYFARGSEPQAFYVGQSGKHTRKAGSDAADLQRAWDVAKPKWLGDAPHLSNDGQVT
jgi:hypothetical protein